MIIQSDEEIMILLDNVFTNRYSRIRKSSIKRIRKKMHFKYGYFSNDRMNTSCAEIYFLKTND